MRLLAECNWDTFAKYHAAEDPLTTGKQYGVVQNPRVKVSILNARLLSELNVNLHSGRQHSDRPRLSSELCQGQRLASSAAKALIQPSKEPLLRLKDLTKALRRTKTLLHQTRHPMGKSSNQSRPRRAQAPNHQGSKKSIPISSSPSPSLHRSQVKKIMIHPLLLQLQKQVFSFHHLLLCT